MLIIYQRKVYNLKIFYASLRGKNIRKNTSFGTNERDLLAIPRQQLVNLLPKTKSIKFTFRIIDLGEDYG